LAYHFGVRVLFLHQNFPGQFKHLATALAARGHAVRALAITPRTELPGVTVHAYRVAGGNVQGLHPWVQDFETKTLRAEACARAMLQLADDGFVPDVVVGHAGWGEAWFVKDVWPRVPLLAMQEFFYGADMSFDPEFGEATFEARCRTRTKNAAMLTGLHAMDWGFAPTHWQRSQFPEAHRSRISVVFDGIDTDALRPDPQAFISLEKKGLRFTADDEVVTFVSRNLEPYRGFHIFMRALGEVLRARPRAHVVIVGGDDPGYGARAPAGTTWRELYLRETAQGLDLSRVHFVGRIPYGTLLSLLRVSTCHVYLTYPFVLSWSMLEAMSLGCLVVGSRTGPVEEVIRDGENGLLTDFFDVPALSGRIIEALAQRTRFEPLRRAARQTVVERYDLARVCLPRQLALVEAVCAGERPSI
jgi:glycosyltransferase involved in cell wall biosynthesis